MKNIYMSPLAENVKTSQKASHLVAVKAPLLGLAYILFFPFIGLAASLVLCAQCAKRNWIGLLHRHAKVVTVVK